MYIGGFILKFLGLIIFKKGKLAMADYSWLCSHVINPDPFLRSLRRSSLLALRLPPFERKSENI